MLIISKVYNYIMIKKFRTRLLSPYISDLCINSRSVKYLKKRIQKKRALKTFTADMKRVSIVSRDRLRLCGYYKEVPDAKRFIIAAHGWRSTSATDFKYQHELFCEDECNVLYIDERCHGNSEGKYIGFGVLERYDILLWARYAVKNLSNGLPVYLFGVSMGATSVMMASALDLPADVKGIIADCGFTSPMDIWLEVTKNIEWLDKELFYKLSNKRCMKLAGYDATQHSTIRALEKTDIPILFIHGGADTFVPPEMTKLSYNACASKKKIVIFEGAAHAKSCVVAPELYAETLGGFYNFCEQEMNEYGAKSETTT